MGYMREWAKYLPFAFIRRWVGTDSYMGAYLCWKNPYNHDSKDVIQPVEVIEVYDGEWIVRSQKRKYEIQKRKLMNELELVEEKLNILPKTEDTYDDE